MTAPRIIVARATTAVTRRTTLRKAFLAPWHPLVPKLWLYALADAQRNTDVAVHHGICVVNHHHLTVTPEHDNLPVFTHALHRDVSRGLNTLLAQEHYDAPGELFDGRGSHYMRLLDAPAQATQLDYEHNNCVAAGLVGRPEHMPGYFFDFDLWKTGYIDVERPPIYFDSSRPDVLRLELTPPPLLLQAFGGDLDRLIYRMKRLSLGSGQTLRAKRKRPPLGARRIGQLHPWSEPRTLRERGGQRVPSFRIGARGIDGRQTAAAAARETHTFRAEHEEARIARRDGDIERRFPYGSYNTRVLHRAPIEPEPKPGALVTRPGPLACEVQAQCEAAANLEQRQAVKAQSYQLLQQAREAFDDEAEQLLAQDDLDFDRPEASAAAVTASSADDETRSVAKTRHRFDRDVPGAEAQHPRRIVTLRDARRGRPPRKRRRRGADPPD